MEALVLHKLQTKEFGRKILKIKASLMRSYTIKLFFGIRILKIIEMVLKLVYKNLP